MRIIRFRDPQGQIHFGVAGAAGSAHLLAGDLLGSHALSDQQAVIAQLLAPLPIMPPAIFCIGLNYLRHAEETKAKFPTHPVVFMKNPAAVQDPGAPIEIPTRMASGKVDYECELAIIIGRKAKNVSVERALDYVMGYTAANDVSARDWQREWGGSQWCRAKTFDTFCPLGPALLTPDEIPNPNALALCTTLNGQVMQSSNTSDMIFSVPQLIAFLAGSTTLLPGTVILTGTPEGVGMARTPPVYLKPGDRVAITIDQIGRLENPVIAEP